MRQTKSLTESAAALW